MVICQTSGGRNGRKNEETMAEFKETVKNCIRETTLSERAQKV